MCRLLGIVASEPTEFRMLLREAPRSLSVLSQEHRDGWGLAVFGDGDRWTLDRSVLSAHEDERFHTRAVASTGTVLVSHIRRKTVGPTRLENTHPFRRGRWVFAHNGTVRDLEWLRRRSSPERLREVEGDTDSELFFAFLLTRMDEAGVTHDGAGERCDEVVACAARACRERAGHPGADNGFGIFNFLLSDGSALYAHRFGRTLYILERGPHDEVRSRRESVEGAVVETPWSRRRRAVFVASERMTGEAWLDVEEGALLRIDRAPDPRVRLLAALP